MCALDAEVRAGLRSWSCAAADAVRQSEALKAQQGTLGQERALALEAQCHELQEKVCVGPCLPPLMCPWIHAPSLARPTAHGTVVRGPTLPFHSQGLGVDTALWLDTPPSPKRAQLTSPPNPTETDPRGPKFNKKKKMGFLYSTRRGGSEKPSFANAQNFFRRFRRQSSYYLSNAPVN